MATEIGHAAGRAYFDRLNGALHLNGSTLYVLSGSKLDADDGSAITLNQLLAETAADSLTATTGGQSAALQLTADINRITTCAAGYGVALPAAVPGLTLIVINNGANPLTVYGNNTAADTIDGNATGTGVVQMVNSVTLYCCTVAGQWFSNGIGTGYATSLPTSSYTDALTTNTTQTQAAGTAITTVLNRFTTVSNNGDAATLMPSAPGLSITVINAGAHSMQIFPNAGGTTSEQINALGANAAISVASTKVITFYCTVAGQWHTILTA